MSTAVQQRCQQEKHCAAQLLPKAQFSAWCVPAMLPPFAVGPSDMLHVTFHILTVVLLSLTGPLFIAFDHADCSFEGSCL